MKELIERWDREANEAVPPEYADRGLHRKYLNGDVYAGGQRDCAIEAREWLDSLWTKVDPKKRRTWPKGDCFVTMNIAGVWTTPKLNSSGSDESNAAVDGVDVRWRPIIPGIDTVE